MKILLLTAATGGGHIRAAAAIEKHLRDNCPGIEVKTEDAFKAISSIFDKTICDGYHFLATKAPKMFGKLYESTNQESHFASLVPKLSGIFRRRLLPSILEFDPDVIITTHPFVTEMISCLKEDGKVSALLLCVMTDYGPHKSWVSPAVDAYIVSNEDMMETMVRHMGVPREKIFPFGIPVHDVFFEKADRQAILRELGLDENRMTILIMAGSFGVNNILSVFREITALPQDFQMIIITGRNEKLYHAFEEELPSCPKSCKLVYFTKEVEKYMKAANLIVTKPGGLTVSEALACNIPLAVFDAIPGQEEDNANFLMNHGMAVRIGKGDSCAATIQSLLEDEEKLEEMKRSCEKFDKSQSIPKMLDLIQYLLKKKGEA